KTRRAAAPLFGVAPSEWYGSRQDRTGLVPSERLGHKPPNKECRRCAPALPRFAGAGAQVSSSEVSARRAETRHIEGRRRELTRLESGLRGRSTIPRYRPRKAASPFQASRRIPGRGRRVMN